jgi:Family of unknown function (DUF6173)
VAKKSPKPKPSRMVETINIPTAGGEESRLAELFQSPITGGLFANFLHEHGSDKASGARKRLEAWIRTFESQLSEAEEMVVRLASMGSLVDLHVQEIKSAKPMLIVFVGMTPQGKRAHLIQHISQISIVLTSVPKTGAQARRLGFGPPENNT